MILNDIRKRLFLTLLTVVIVLLLFIRFSYSAFTVQSVGEENTLQFGDISMRLCEGTTCNAETSLISPTIGTRKFEVDGQMVTGYIPAYPISDDFVTGCFSDSTGEGCSSLQSYTFTITNDGDLNLYTKLRLEAYTGTDLNYTINRTISGGTTYTYNGLGENGSKVSGNNTDANENFYIDATENYNEPVTSNQYKYFKVGIAESTSDTLTVADYGTIAETNNYAIASNIVLNSNQTRTYNMYIWLSEEALIADKDTEGAAGEGYAAINDVIGKYFVTQITAQSEYIPDSPTPTPTPTETP